MSFVLFFFCFALFSKTIEMRCFFWGGGLFTQRIALVFISFLFVSNFVCVLYSFRLAPIWFVSEFSSSFGCCCLIGNGERNGRERLLICQHIPGCRVPMVNKRKTKLNIHECKSFVGKKLIDPRAWVGDRHKAKKKNKQ